MSSIISKKIKGNTYYYLVESARVGGKPRIVSQRYLGKASDIDAAMAGSQVLPERTRHLGFGDLTVALSILRRLQVKETVDGVVGSRCDDVSASVGTYVELMVANRVVAPCSKLAFSDWWQTTAGDRFVKLPIASLDHRKFWDAMDELSPPMLEEIEQAVTSTMVDEFAIATDGLVLDMTNVTTYVDSANERNTIAKRGHSKQKRYDLRIVGLSLIVTRDGAVPVASHAYGGNKPDVTQFATALKALRRQFPVTDEELTIVFDAGMDSKDNLSLLEDLSLALRWISGTFATSRPVSGAAVELCRTFRRDTCWRRCLRDRKGDLGPTLTRRRHPFTRVPSPTVAGIRSDDRKGGWRTFGSLPSSCRRKDPSDEKGRRGRDRKDLGTALAVSSADRHVVWHDTEGQVTRLHDR
jgi:hypothetical protein